MEASCGGKIYSVTVANALPAETATMMAVVNFMFATG